jgi:hypothetical protein
MLVRRLAGLFLLASLLLFAVNLPAAGFDKVWIIKSANTEQYRDIAAALSLGVNAQCTKLCSSSSIKAIDLDELTQINHNDRNLLITIGTKAYDTVSELPTSKTGEESVFYHTLLPLEQKTATASHAFFWLEQSPSTQVKVLERLLGTNRDIYLFYSDESEWRVSDWQKAAAQSRLRFKFEKIRPKDIGTELSSDKLNGKTVVLLPDKKIYNRFTLKQILLAGYLNQVTLIGYSKALSKSGAAASIITDLDAYLLETSKLIVQIIESGKLPENSFPQGWKVILNNEIIQSLNLQIDKSRFEEGQLEELQQ